LETASELVSKAFSSLESSRGFTPRASQLQLSLLISDLMENPQSGVFEAPTGVGKSLAALIPALVHASLSAKRTVIATYTNVLAEQYWNKEVPLARGILQGILPNLPNVRLLMGRQRYACLTQVGERNRDMKANLLAEGRIGHETEFRKIFGKAGGTWSQIAVPVVCPARLCPDYQSCFYYSARKLAAKAQVVITNHSVVMQDAIMKQAEGSDGLLGEYDFLILDEAHDFHLAAANGLEFELNASKLQTFTQIGLTVGRLLQPTAESARMASTWRSAVAEFEQSAIACQQELQSIGLKLSRAGIVASSPESLTSHPSIQSNRADITPEDVAKVGLMVEDCCDSLSDAIDEVLIRGEDVRGTGSVDSVRESIRNYRAYLDEFSGSIRALLLPTGVSVTHAGKAYAGAKIRLDTISLPEPLTRLIWSQIPTVFLSATLAVDNSFDFFRGSVGCEPAFEEILEAPFDYASQASLYLPRRGVIPDPSEARKSGSEYAYHRAIAEEIDHIIEICQGRTLALFHSRKEMEAVAGLVSRRPEHPILVQPSQGVAEVGEQFKNNVGSCLFALRSFWTGFDAPGETLSCVVLVRIPFEVPIEPPQIARSAYLQSQGVNPFAAYTLPLAKMLVRQGAGRLIRGIRDRGVIAILDPRVQTKPYGSEFLENLPAGIRSYDDFEEAAGAVGLLTPMQSPLLF
jgi:ATP-dependent DNA helicase DinG